MALKAPANSQNSKFTKQDALEPGTYPARVVRVLDLGLQAQTDFTTKEPKKPQNMISVTYELVDVFMADEEGNDIEDKPRWISDKDFPLHPMSSDLATSTKRMLAIDPSSNADGDWSQVLGFPCMVTVGNYTGQDGSLKDKVLNVTAVRARDAARMPELQNDAKFFDLDEPDVEFFNSLPKWVREKIQGNLQYAGSPLEKLLGGKASAPKAEAEEAPKPAKKPARKPVVQEAEEEDGGVGEDAPW